MSSLFSSLHVTCIVVGGFFCNDTATTEIYTDTLFPYTTLCRSPAFARVLTLGRGQKEAPATGPGRSQSPYQAAFGAAWRTPSSTWPANWVKLSMKSWTSFCAVAS